MGHLMLTRSDATARSSSEAAEGLSMGSLPAAAAVVGFEESGEWEWEEGNQVEALGMGGASCSG